MNEKITVPASHVPILGDGAWLFLDAAGREPLVGIWKNEHWLALRKADGVAATEGLFAQVDDVLRWVSLKLADCAGFIFVEGPGSIMGIRIAAMALRAWRALPAFSEKPIFGVGSLALAGHLMRAAFPTQQSFSLLADSRQGLWNVATVCDGLVPSDFEEMRIEQLAALPAPRFRISQRALGTPPVLCENFPTDLLEKNPGVLTTPGLLHPCEQPDAVNMPGEFVKWAPARHR